MKNLLDQLSKEDREVIESSKLRTMITVKQALKANRVCISLRLDDITALWWALNPAKPFDLIGFYDLFTK